MGDNVLTLETLEPVRDVVTIDGIGYELLMPEDFGIREQIKLGHLIKRIGALEDVDEPSDADLVTIQVLYDDALRLIVRGLPAEYLGTVKVPKGKQPPTYTEGRLRFVQKQRILTVFTARRRLRSRTAPEESQPTSENSSPDSAASTDPTTG